MTWSHCYLHDERLVETVSGHCINTLQRHFDLMTCAQCSCASLAKMIQLKFQGVNYEDANCYRKQNVQFPVISFL